MPSRTTPPPTPPVPLPRGWRHTTDRASGVLLRARPPVAGSSGVLPEVVLGTRPLDGPRPDPEWVDDDLHDLAARLELFALEDEDAWSEESDDPAGSEESDDPAGSEESDDPAGSEEPDGPGEVHYRRFAHRRGVHDLLVERWCWEVDGRGHVLEATCDREDYEEFCDVFEELARAARSATACGSVRAS